MTKDPYQVLGVSQSATAEEIKAAYRKKAKEYHPDLHPDDPTASDRMNEVNEAYDILSDSEKLAAYKAGYYDQTGFGPSQASSFSGWNPYTGPSYGGGPTGYGNGYYNGYGSDAQNQSGSYRTSSGTTGNGTYYRTYTWSSDGSNDDSYYRQPYRSYVSPGRRIIRGIWRFWLWSSLIRFFTRLFFGFFRF